MSRLCTTLGVVSVLALFEVWSPLAFADENALLIEQIGDKNRAISSQGAVPTGSQVETALETGQNAELFDLLEAGTVAETADLGFLSPNSSINDLLSDFRGRTGGSNNVSEVRQNGSRNKALSVQVDGKNNRLLTEQSGNDNIGVHLQRGSGNNTELVQIGDGNENALIAVGSAISSDGGPLTLLASGGVKGFSIRADGPQQNFSTVRVQPNANGGLNINLQR